MNAQLVESFLGSPQPSVSFIIQDGGIEYSYPVSYPLKIRLLCRLEMMDQTVNSAGGGGGGGRVLSEHMSTSSLSFTFFLERIKRQSQGSSPPLFFLPSITFPHSGLLFCSIV